MEQNVFTRIFEINYRGSKVLFAILTAVLLTISVRAQVPEMMSYKAVIRDAGNELVTSQEVGMQIAILQGSANGTAVEPGQYAQTLNFCNGVPTWGPCPASVTAVVTGTVTNITPTSATGGGTVVSQGSASVTSRGIVWSTSSNPTTQQTRDS